MPTAAIRVSTKEKTMLGETSRIDSQKEFRAPLTLRLATTGIRRSALAERSGPYQFTAAILRPPDGFSASTLEECYSASRG
jgi:hypothetical protein